MNITKHTDFSGEPVYVIPTADGLTRFFPYNPATIHEYLKARQEVKLKRNKS